MNLAFPVHCSPLDGSSSYGNINGNQTSNGQSYSLQISNDAVNLEDLQLNLSISAEGTNTNCIVPVFVQGPHIEIVSSNVNLNSRVINISVANNGSLSVQNLDLNLSSLYTSPLIELIVLKLIGKGTKLFSIFALT